MPAQKLMSTIVRLQRERRQKFGAGHLIDILRGKETPRVRQYGHDALATWGIGADLSEQQWRGVVRQLLAQGLLATHGEYGTLTVTDAASEVLSGARTVMLRTEPERAPRSRGPRAAPVAADLEPAQAELFEALRAWRAAEAREQGVPAYIVFGDATLRGVAAGAADACSASSTASAASGPRSSRPTARSCSRSWPSTPDRWRAATLAPARPAERAATVGTTCGRARIAACRPATAAASVTVHIRGSAMSDQFGPKRPLGVTIVAALAIIAAVFDIIGGIVLLGMQGDTDAAAGFGGTGMMVTLGISSILFGAFMLVVVLRPAAWQLRLADRRDGRAGLLARVVDLDRHRAAVDPPHRDRERPAGAGHPVPALVERGDAVLQGPRARPADELTAVTPAAAARTSLAGSSR